jgi:hypothetical protein
MQLVEHVLGGAGLDNELLKLMPKLLEKPLYPLSDGGMFSGLNFCRHEYSYGTTALRSSFKGLPRGVALGMSRWEERL